MKTQPGARCPCGCTCAVPIDPSRMTCPCTCGCAVCGSRSIAPGRIVGPQRTPDNPARTSPISVESAARPTPRRFGETMASPVPAAGITLSESQFLQLLALTAPPPAPAAPPKPLHEMNQEELSRAVGERFSGYLSRTGGRRITGA